eukprot:TRINITY_DN3002_c0_g1_i2.p1 TRINITY_DN3002_c0_g1~~TRINITY_DN3002_c0_g1_i2.p1  ORF type:complete len:548 (-),score=131.57 TRINITY_DN3002_c0_g1_i2:737-2380(-)
MEKSAVDLNQMRSELYRQLLQRNSTQTTAFRDMFEKYQKVVKSKQQLAERVSTLENELSSSQQKLRQVESDLTYVREQTQSGTYSQTRLAALEERLSAAQEETKDALKKYADQATKALALMVSQKELEVDLDRMKAENLNLEDEIVRKNKVISDLEKKINGLETTTEVLKEELRSLQVALVKKEDTLKQSELEKTSMIEQLLKLKNIQAELVNRENMMYEERMGTLGVGSGSASSTEGTEAVEPVSYTLPAKVKKVINTAHQDEINALAFNRTGTTFASGSLDKTVKIWDTKSGNRITTLQGPVQGVMCVQFSENEESVLGTSNENSIRVWSTQTQRVKHTLTGHTAKVYSAKFFVDGQKIVSGSHDRTLRLWDLNKGYCVKTIFCTSSCNDLDISRDSRIVVSGHFDNQIRVIDCRNGETCQEIATAHTGQVTSIEISKDGNYILTNSRDNTIKMIDCRNWQVAKTFRHDQYRNGLNWTKSALSHDGNFIAAGSHDGPVFIWNVRTEAVEKILRDAHRGAVPSVAWHPSGGQLISCDKDKNIVVWE